ncbi:MAG: archaemetzincin, partial [Bacteroidota bacterium]
MSRLFILSFFICLTQCQPAKPPPNETLAQSYTRKLKVLHQLPEAERPNDWRASHPEVRQTFEAYQEMPPTSLTAERKYIYITTLGEFSAPEKYLIRSMKEYLNDFFQLPVRLLPLSDSIQIPEKYRRINKHTQEEQVLSTYLLRRILTPNLPDSAAVFVAFTTWDLYPSKNWNYVFGQADLRARTGVWSLARLGEGKLLRDRTFKTAAHEIGHIFSIRHCQDFACVMAGSNNRPELDR